MYYNYHSRIRQRISAGELIGIAPSNKDEFAFVLIFSTAPQERPIRARAAHLYEDVLGDKL